VEDEVSDLVLAEVLIDRGWRTIIDGQAWEWPDPATDRPATDGSATDDPALAHGACILVDDQLRGYLVEGPTVRDEPGTWLCYRTRRELLQQLPALERWTLAAAATGPDAVQLAGTR